MSEHSSARTNDNITGQKISRFILITSISLISFFPLNILLPSFPALALEFNTSMVDIAFAVSLFTCLLYTSDAADE